MATSNYVNTDELAAAGRTAKVFQQGFQNSVSQGHSLVLSSGGVFGPEAAGQEMLVQYQELARGLFESLDSAGEVIGRVGDTADHSAKAFESTNEGTGIHTGGPAPADHAPVVGDHAPAPGGHAPVK